MTVGYQHSPREKIFAAVIDDVEVKRVSRALAARHRARQPRVPPRRGDDRLHAPDLRPRDRHGRHGHRGALLAGASSRRRASSATARPRRATEQIAAWPRVPLPDHLAARVADASRSGTRSSISSRGPSGGAGSRTWSSSTPATTTGSARTRGSPGARSCPTTSSSRRGRARSSKPRLIEAEAFGELAGHRPLAPVRAGRGDRGRSTSGTSRPPSAG